MKHKMDFAFRSGCHPQADYNMQVFQNPKKSEIRDTSSPKHFGQGMLNLSYDYASVAVANSANAKTIFS
jgi:hypothetical protein